jgi:hypothetical protein
MPGLKVDSSLTHNAILEVNKSSEVKLALPAIDDSGFAAPLSCIDDGSAIGVRTVRPLIATEDYRLRSNIDTILLDEMFVGATLSSSQWAAPVTTMTVVVGSSTCTLNNNASTATGAVAQLTSYRTFPFWGVFPLKFETIMALTQTPQANNTCEWGLFLASGTTAPTDGAFFRLDSSGNFKAVINFNGTEVVSSNINFGTYIGAGNFRRYHISVYNDYVEFWVGTQLTAKVGVPDTIPLAWSAYNLPVSFRTYNSGAGPATAQKMQISLANVSLLGANSGITAPVRQALAGQNSAQADTAQTAYWVNSPDVPVLPTNYTMSNTASPAGSIGLGGLFNPTIAGLTSNTDYIVMSYALPAASATTTNMSLVITGIKISACNQVVASTGVIAAEWAVTFGSTAVSLATTETATSKAHRRIAVGCNLLPNAAAVGQMFAPDLSHKFETPIVVNPGEQFAVVFRPVTYTSTATETMLVTVMVNGHWI